ncbi:MAG: DUF1344 domain-containing protein [Rhizobiaceae bacterium]
MKKLAFLIAALLFALPHTAQADDVTGKIVSIDEGEQSLKLDDGNVYKLPGEFDYTVIAPDMKVMIVFDVNGEEKLVTDIEKAE